MFLTVSSNALITVNSLPDKHVSVIDSTGRSFSCASHCAENLDNSIVATLVNAEQMKRHGIKMQATMNVMPVVLIDVSAHSEPNCWSSGTSRPKIG